MNWFCIILSVALAFMAGHSVASESTSAYGLVIASVINLSVGIWNTKDIYENE